MAMKHCAFTLAFALLLAAYGHLEATPESGNSSVPDQIPSAADETKSTVVDFDRQVLTVWGLGGMPWETQVSQEQERSRAWMNALHQAYDAVLDIYLIDGLRTANVLHRNPALKETLGTVLRSIQPVFHEPDLSGLVRCRLDIPFFGRYSLRSALYLSAIRPGTVQPPALTPPISTEPVQIQQESRLDMDRIAIDMRNTNFDPSIFPRFFSESGHLIFQETMIPQSHRFSRPVVQFTRDIRKVYSNVEGEKVLMIVGKTDSLSRFDIRIPHHETGFFEDFCKSIIAEPSSNKEILIVYRKQSEAAGSFPKTKAEPDKKKAAKSPAKKP